MAFFSNQGEKKRKKNRKYETSKDKKKNEKRKNKRTSSPQERRWLNRLITLKRRLLQSLASFQSLLYKLLATSTIAIPPFIMTIT